MLSLVTRRAASRFCEKAPVSPSPVILEPGLGRPHSFAARHGPLRGSSSPRWPIASLLATGAHHSHTTSMFLDVDMLCPLTLTDTCKFTLPAFGLPGPANMSTRPLKKPPTRLQVGFGLTLTSSSTFPDGVAEHVGVPLMEQEPGGLADTL